MASVVGFFRSLAQTPLQTTLNRIIDSKEPLLFADQLVACLILAVDATSPAKSCEDCVHIPLNTLVNNLPLANRDLENDPDVVGERPVLHALDVLRYLILGFSDVRCDSYVEPPTNGSLVTKSAKHMLRVGDSDDATVVIGGSEAEHEAVDLESKSSRVDRAYDLSNAMVEKLLPYRDQIERLALPILKVHPKLMSRLLVVSADEPSPSATQRSFEAVEIESEEQTLEFVTSVTGARPVAAAALLMAIDAINKHGAKIVHIRHKLTGITQPPPRLLPSANMSATAGAQTATMPTAPPPQLRLAQEKTQQSTLLPNLLLSTHEIGAQRLLSLLPLFVSTYLDQ